MATVVRENKYARILSYARGASDVVQERIKNKWETVTIFHGNRSTALHLYDRLTKKKKELAKGIDKEANYYYNKADSSLGGNG